jgi:hypothetical protein
VGEKFFRAYGQTDKYGETNSRFPQFCERTQIYYININSNDMELESGDGMDGAAFHAIKPEME